MTVVINLFGSSGSGKSTTALGLAYKLKMQGYKVEVVTEWIKEKVFSRDFSVLKDQLYIFAKQKRKQFILQDKNLDYIITDSPLILSSFYGRKYNTIDSLIESVIFNEFSKFENINFFLKRTHPFDPMGRMETEEQSDKDSKDMYNFLDLYLDFETIDQPEKTDQIMKILNLGNKQ